MAGRRCGGLRGAPWAVLAVSTLQPQRSWAGVPRRSEARLPLPKTTKWRRPGAEPQRELVGRGVRGWSPRELGCLSPACGASRGPARGARGRSRGSQKPSGRRGVRPFTSSPSVQRSGFEHGLCRGQSRRTPALCGTRADLGTRLCGQVLGVFLCVGGGEERGLEVAESCERGSVRPLGLAAFGRTDLL